MLERKDREAEGEDADDDRGDAIEQVCRIADDKGGGVATEFCKINGAKKPDRYPDQCRQQKQLGAADDGVGHSAAGFAYRCREFGKEVPVHGISTMKN